MYREQNTELYLEIENETINLFNTVLAATGNDEAETMSIMESALESAKEQYFNRYYK